MVIVQKTYHGTHKMLRALGSMALIAIGFFIFFFTSSKSSPVSSGEVANPFAIGAEIVHADHCGCADSGGDCGGCGY